MITQSTLLTILVITTSCLVGLGIGVVLYIFEWMPSWNAIRRGFGIQQHESTNPQQAQASTASKFTSYDVYLHDSLHQLYSTSVKHNEQVLEAVRVITQQFIKLQHMAAHQM